MRAFEIHAVVRVHAKSFSGAEKLFYEAMRDSFNSSDGENPKSFYTLAITKGPKVKE